MNDSGTDEAVIQELHGLDNLKAIVSLYTEIWGVPLVTSELLQAISHAGGYLGGVFLGDTLAAACVGFLGPDASLHSHISGTAPWARNRGLGRRLKRHQRAWALSRGLTSITWTFDPLIARNAHLNIAVLGARPEEYLVDFYGPMPDSVNEGQLSDRLMVRWLLQDSAPAHTAATREHTSSLILRDDDGAPQASPVRDDARVIRVQIPGNADTLRLQDPDLARRWRLTLRDALRTRMVDGWRVTNFDDDSCYVLELP